MIHMLVVDDEAEEREGILFLLHKYGFNMETGQAPNGKAALDYLKNRAVDILFTDVRMPFMDGLTLAKEALLLQPNIRVILFSGFSEFEYAKTAISLGVREYILKPVNVEEFCTVMQRVSAPPDCLRAGTSSLFLSQRYSLGNIDCGSRGPVRSRLFESIYQHGLARVQPEFFRSRWARIL